MRYKKILLNARSIAAFLLAAVLLFGCTAVSASDRFIENCVISNDNSKLYIMCADGVSSTGTLDPSQLKITLGDYELAPEGIAGSSELPVTYYCLVDVSGSMNSQQMDQAKTALYKIVELMGEGDNMVIGTLGNTVTPTDFTSDKEALNNIISTLAPGNEDTNLYAGIVNSISALKSGIGVNYLRCLVILTDGMDDMVSGYTRDEAVRAISGSNIPVYTVAALRGAEQADSAKQLGELARLSSGGFAFAPVIDGISGADAGANIVTSMNSGFVVQTDVSNISIGTRDEFLLRVQSTAVNGNLTEDTMQIYASDLPVIKHDDPTPAEFPYWLIYLAAAAALILAAVIAALIMRSKKKKRLEAERIEREKREAEEQERLRLEEERRKENEERQKLNAAAAAENSKKEEIEIYEPTTSSGRVDVKMIAIGSAHKTISFKVPTGKRFSIGRNGKADFIPDGFDKRLSGKHCAFYYFNGVMKVMDLGSTNGTYLNGIRVGNEGSEVHNNDEILIGSHEYRVQFNK